MASEQKNGILVDEDAKLKAAKDHHDAMLAILNETARRVHTVMANYASHLAGRRPELALTADESQALFNGAVSGIAAFVAMTDIRANPAIPNPPPIEDVLCGIFTEQFKAVFLDHRERVAQAQAMAATGGAGKPS